MAIATHGNTTTIIRDLGSHTTVPNNAIAHLRYYLDIVLNLLDIDDDSLFVRLMERRPNLKELRNYSTSKPLTRDELAPLIGFCMTFSPDDLIGTLLIQDDALCGDRQNKIFAVSKIERNMLIADSAVIGGQRHTVKTVMAFKAMWLVRFWIAPMKFIMKPEALEEKLAKIRQLIPSIVFLEAAVEFRLRPPASSCCIIL